MTTVDYTYKIDQPDGAFPGKVLIDIKATRLGITIFRVFWVN